MQIKKIWEKYQEPLKQLPYEQQEALEQLVRDLGYNYAKFPKKARKKDTFLLSLKKNSQKTYGNIAKAIEEDTGEKVSYDTVKRLIKRNDMNSSYVDALAKCFNVTPKYIKTGIVWGKSIRKIGGKKIEMKYIKECHRSSTQRTLKGHTDKEVFEALPLEMQKCIIAYTKRLAMLY